MAGVKGKFITLTGMLMSDNLELLEKANQFLENKIGLRHLELDQEEFYDTTVWNDYMHIYTEGHTNPKQAIIDLGMSVYPTIKRTAGMPPHLKTPLDYIVFEAEGFRMNHAGDDVIQRKIIEESSNHIVMYAPAPGYDENLYIGVWLGILEMIGIDTGKIDELGDHTYRISW